MSKKFVYLFREGNATMRELLGGKGANLAEMTVLGLPVPAGFTVSTEACSVYHENNRQLPDSILSEIKKAVSDLEKQSGKGFGDVNNPLLLSVRSGARVSMPGMMDTILNLGLNDDTVVGLINRSKDERFAYDSYRRFVQMYGNVVKQIDKDKFEHRIDEMKAKKGVKLDSELTSDDLKELIEEFKQIYKNEVNEEFPSEPMEQLIESVRAVFRSWENPRAITYRRMHDIPSSWGTAVNVQTMVFGNMGATSGTGVAFSRNPATGEDELYGEYLMNAQGEDVVAGVRTPSHISELKIQNEKIYNEFYDIAKKLEKHYKDMQDMEFTIEDGKLYILQTRNGKRTATAALKIAVDLVNEGMRTKEEALLMLDAKQLDNLLHPTFDVEELKSIKPIATGLPASPGSASGKIVFNADEAIRAGKLKEKVILVRLETSPEDIEGMNVAQGVLTARGGMTSHAAVVARGMGTACVAGCSELSIDENKGVCVIGGHTFKRGDYISIDGATGNIYGKELKSVPADISGDFATIMQWADEYRRIGVRANAETVNDAIVARKFGAQGIGLSRTEHMFFDAERINIMREMILSSTLEERKNALNKLLPFQRGDFEKLFEVMEGLPVTIRLLDPPLHEFLPQTKEEINTLAKQMGKKPQEIERVIAELYEFNPMMGHRGCRLDVTYPEIGAMQTRAIIEAAINVNSRLSKPVIPEIMIPLVGDIKELKYVKEIIDTTAKEVMQEKGLCLEYSIGTMIELPRAVLIADEIAKEVDFFSFGTNDLTQMTYGFSRDDAGKFLKYYYDKGIFDFDPFARLDEKGVGKLVKMAADSARNVKKDFKLGVCGEHGGDPKSVEFCDRVGLTYTSCSPYRVPIARLAGAQSALRKK